MIRLLNMIKTQMIRKHFLIEFSEELVLLISDIFVYKIFTSKKTYATLKITIPNVMWLRSEIKKKTFLFEIFIQR